MVVVVEEVFLGFSTVPYQPTYLHPKNSYSTIRQKVSETSLTSTVIDPMMAR